MFKKALIAEDHESTNISVRSTLERLNIAKDYRYYCDHALTAIQKALQEDQPYDLLITDLSFDEDHQNIQQIDDGRALIKAVRTLQPTIKVIVFSIESDRSTVDELFEEFNINAYVRKARYDAEHLREAIETVFSNKKYCSPDLKQSERKENAYEFTHYDTTIVSLLCEMPQKNIPDYLKNNNIKPYGLSSVEKHLGKMRNALNISTNTQLIAYCKDKKII